MSDIENDKLVCQSCGGKFIADELETVMDKEHGPLYKCPHCGTIANFYMACQEKDCWDRANVCLAAGYINQAYDKWVCYKHVSNICLFTNKSVSSHQNHQNDR